MATEPTTFSDGGFITGSYSSTINGYAYVLNKQDHDLPVSEAHAFNADGTPKGGGYVRGKEKIAVTIDAISGTPAPARMIPFNQAFDGYAAKWWIVTNLKIASANTGASLRTYSADIMEHINIPS